MGDALAAALYFEDCAKAEPRPEDRARLLGIAREFRWLAMAEGRRYIRGLPKRPQAPSIRRNTAALRRA
jgi:hypothetical protein